MGGAVSAGESNDDLIDNLLEADYIKSPSVERVFRAVDRAHYLTKDFKDSAYKDLAWKSGNLHISAPCIYSEVMESLKLSPGLSFLNLGSGTGYLSTMAGLILGPYGINHGVEIHKDVIQYAHEKLNKFWSKSSALDEYEFCYPKFVHGNCLNITTDERQYDRVYCGAACPEHHENYMKNLIKIGGVLVMPLNDQLLQIIRTSETTWDVKTVLPVSFASLLLPEQTQMSEQVELPETEPSCLQDICRSTIRCLLRQNVEQENPHIKTRRHNEKKVSKKGNLRRYVVPIFEESDGEEYFRAVPPEVLGVGHAALVYELDRQRNGRMATVIDWARNLDVAEEGDASQAFHSSINDALAAAGQEEAQADSTYANNITNQAKEIPKRIKFDSGIGEEMENGKGLSSESEGEGSVGGDSDSEMSDIMSIGMDPCTEGRYPQVSWNRKLNVTRFESSEDGSQISPEDTNLVSEEEDDFPPLDPDSYGKHMRSKIQALPLPIQLKHYLNLYRDF